MAEIKEKEPNQVLLKIKETPLSFSWASRQPGYLHIKYDINDLWYDTDWYFQSVITLEGYVILT